MDRDGLLAALLVRDDSASARAAAAIQRGVRILDEWGTSAPATLARHFSANDDDGWAEPNTEVFGHEASMHALRTCPLSVVETFSLEDTPNERWFIHLDPQSDEVVACHGVVHAPNPPTPLHNREDIPDTVADAAAAFGSHRLIDGQPRPYDVQVTCELSATEAEHLHASWPHRRSGFYSQAPSIRILGGAEVAGHDPQGAKFSGYLLILDVAASQEMKRHRYGRIDCLLLKPGRQRGRVELMSCMFFQYRPELED